MNLETTSAVSRWTSPLKPKPQNSRCSYLRDNGIFAAAQRVLFDNKIAPKEQTLSTIYKVNLETPPLVDYNGQFFKIRDIVKNIDDVLKKYKPCALTSQWLQRVSTVLSEQNFEKKMAELGAILFYLDKDETNFETLASEPSLLEYRANELHQEVTDYIKSNLGIQFSCLPSGKTHYLMRAFAHMVLTKNLVFNRGGLIAIKELLCNPKHQIAQYIQPEHKDHIVTVVDELLSKPAYERIFSQAPTIAESLKDLIRIDLKLNCNADITADLILYDCLMALFADVRQFDYQNCYAVGSLIYATENHTHKTLIKMLEWLKTGYFCFEGKTNIPILPLLEKRLSFCKDFDVTVNPSLALASAPVEHIQHTLGIKAATKSDATKKQFLGQAIEKMLEQNSCTSPMSYVAKLYNGYKHNTLVDMQIAILEFANANSMKTQELKLELIETCIRAAQSAGRLSAEQTQNLRQRLEEQLWNQQCREKIVQLKDGNIQVGDFEVIAAGDNAKPLFELLGTSIRTFYLADGTFRQLVSITDLRCAVQATMKKLGITALMHPKQFATRLSYFCTKNIYKHIGIGSHFLQQLDLLVVSDKGGLEVDVLDLAYGIHVSTHKMYNCNTPYQFLDKLLGILKTLDPKKVASFPKFLVASAGRHTWTINPSCWKIFEVCKNNFYPFVQANVFKPAHRKLDSFITSDIIPSIIKRYAGTQRDTILMTEFFEGLRQENGGGLTFRKLRDNIFATLKAPSDNDMMRSIVNEEFSKFPMSKLLLSRVLNNLKLTVSTEKFETLYRHLSSTKSLAFEFARELRQALICEKIAVLDPHDIELEVCRAADLPLPINFGDLNWVDKEKEDPTHISLWIHYSYWDATPCYFARANTESVMPNRHFRNLEIHHPKQSITIVP